MQREKPPEWREKQKGSRGIRRGQRYRLVFQFPIREQYRHAFELADQLGLKHPDCIEHVFPTYADEQCTHVLTEEDFFSTEEREGVDRCIGVICSSVSYELFPNVHENGGIGYQFLYEGDELKCYEHGLLIESVE
ncbi:hypothetical protein LAW98_20095 [Escherichia coli]|nr:hypothetical protein [Escherichia coli]